MLCGSSPRTTALFEKHPDVVRELKLLLKKYVTEGRSPR